MEEIVKEYQTVLLAGSGDLLASVAICLASSGHTVRVFAIEPDGFNKMLNRHKRSLGRDVEIQNISLLSNLADAKDVQLAIAITPEDISVKRKLVKALESNLSSRTIITINTETFSIPSLQEGLLYPEKLIGLNWAEPAHTTFFLEIIDGINSADCCKTVLSLSKNWGKDAYMVSGEGIRSRLTSAMAREASYLADNGYASVEDIDRACRNDAGYYLPFSGNCRYMDLMGTYAYGLVMKDLNPDLSKKQELPEFINNLLADGAEGMENKKGFYNYTEQELEEWKDTMDKFSYQIQEIISKYPST